MLVNGLRSLKELLALPLRSVLKLHGTFRASPSSVTQKHLWGFPSGAKIVLLKCARRCSAATLITLHLLLQLLFSLHVVHTSATLLPRRLVHDCERQT